MKKLILCIGKASGLDALELFSTKTNTQVTKVFILAEDAHEITVETKKIEKICIEKNIPYAFGAPKDSDILSENFDVLLAIKWRHLFSKVLLEKPTLGAFVIHDSLLPKLRGASPLNWAIINGETETGATLFKADGRVDAGPIVAQRKFSISTEDNFEVVSKQMRDCYRALMDDFYSQLASGELCLSPQNEEQATYACRRNPSDGRINWNLSALEIHNFIRGLSKPCPGAFTYLRGEPLIIWKAHVHSPEDFFAGKVPGKVIAVDKTAGTVAILCGKGVLTVEKIQFQGKEFDAAGLLKSISITLGI